MQYIFIHIWDGKGSVSHFPFWQQMIKINESDTTAVAFHISFQLGSCRCNTIWIQYRGSALRSVYSLLLLAVICVWLSFTQHLVLSSMWLHGLLEAKGMWHVKRFSGMSWLKWCLPLCFVRIQTQRLISPFKQTVIALLGMRDKN